MKTFRSAVLRLAAAFLTAAAVLAWGIPPLTVYALNAQITFSDPSAKVGEEVGVRMKIGSNSEDDLGGANVMLSYDPAALEFISGDNAEGGAGSLRISGQSSSSREWTYNLKFKALKAGTTNIKISTAEIYDKSNKLATMDHQGSSKITVSAPEGASSNANLASLQVSPGSLSPAFSADTTEYSVTVGEDVTSLTVSAPLSDGSASLSVNGADSLEMGENTVTCVVTAQDGSEKTYTIKVTRTEGSTPETAAQPADGAVTIGGESYEIAESFDAALLPNGFSAAEFTYGGKTVQAGRSDKNGALVMYLLGDDGSGDLYLYDETSGKWSPYAVVGVASRGFTVLPVSDDVTVPAGFVENPLDLNGRQVTGWVLESDQEQNSCFFYGMNDDGERNFYRYDLKEKTVQRYFEAAAPGGEVQNAEEPGTGKPEEQTPYDELLRKYKKRGIIMTVLGVLSAILLALSLFLLFGGSSGGGGGYSRRAADADEDERRSARQERQGSAAAGRYAGDEPVRHRAAQAPERRTAAPERRTAAPQERRPAAAQERRYAAPAANAGYAAGEAPAAAYTPQRAGGDFEDVEDLFRDYPPQPEPAARKPFGGEEETLRQELAANIRAVRSADVPSDDDFEDLDI